MRTRGTQIVGRNPLTAAVILLVAGLGYSQSAAQVGENPQSTEPQDATAPQAEPLTATVLAVEGVVEYRMSLDDADWQSPLEVNTELPEGAQIRTGLRSRVQLRIGPVSEVTINRLTLATIGQLQTEGDTLRSNIAMQHGKVDFSIRHAGYRNDFKVTTPSGTMAVKGTEGSIITDENTNIQGNQNNNPNSINYNNNSNNQNYNFGGDENYNGDGNGDGEGGGGGGGGEGEGNPTGSLNGNQSFQQSQREFNDQVPDNTGGDA